LYPAIVLTHQYTYLQLTRKSSFKKARWFRQNR